MNHYPLGKIPMISWLKRLQLESEDWLRYHAGVRKWMGRYKAWCTPGAHPNDAQALARLIAHLCTAARCAENDESERCLQVRIVDLVKQLDVGNVDWREFAPAFDEPRLGTAAILKPYVGPREKGVLFISFETAWIKLLRPKNYRDLAERYSVVVAPSSSPHVLINYVFPTAFPGPVFTLISNPKDVHVFPRMSNNLVTVPLYASNWVNPELLQPARKKTHRWDLLMVANWAKVKRHHAFFAALQSMPRDLRILLIGQDQDGRTANTIRETARWYGVHERFTVLADQPYAAVLQHFSQARASTVLSKREGSCVVIAESLFAGAPAAILQEAELGSRVFINDQTGRFLDGRNLAHDLTNFVQQADRYAPRRWAEENISCFRSTRILNHILQQNALENGQEWSQDIAPLQWSPNPYLVRPEDRQRLAPEWQDIRQRFGLEIGAPWVQRERSASASLLLSR